VAGTGAEFGRQRLSLLPAVSQQGFQLDFETAITIIVGENGSGKSTLLEGIAALAGV
jgi:predicted ATPase